MEIIFTQLKQTRKIMHFSMKEWRRCYDTAHGLGKTLRESKPTTNELGEVIPAKTNLKKREQKAIEHNILSILQRTSSYLNHCGMPMPRPMWYYDKENPETHFSDKRFKYGHLLEG